LSRKEALSKTKKSSSPDWERFFVSKMAQDTSLRGEKVAQGGQSISRGAAAPPCPPTSRAYGPV